MFEIRIDPTDKKEIEAIMVGLGKNANSITTRTINKTLTGVRTDATSAIFGKLNLTKKRIREDFLPPEKAYGDKLNGILKSRGKPIGLYSFGARQLKSGKVSVKVLREGRKRIIKHAFVAMSKNSYNVWWRKNIKKGPIKPGLNYAKLPHHMRFPIARLTGPRIQDIYARPEVLKLVLEQGWARYDKEMARLLQLELDKHK